MTKLKYDTLFQPLLVAIKSLGGSATISELQDKVAEDLKLSDEVINKIHKGNRTDFNYKLAWARYYLKAYGLIVNSKRGVWSLTQKGEATSTITAKVVKAFVKSKSRKDITIEDLAEDGSEPMDEDITWQETLLDRIKKMKPTSFEKLCQRILRESGFEQVDVTGKTGDGGIDGKGILKVNGFLNFHVYFQCKRYDKNVSSSIVRDFRGALDGRAERGLLMTTSGFTRDAKQEAIRNGALPIDLIDGYLLAEKMKELKLGLNIELEERVTINNTFFEDYL